MKRFGSQHGPNFPRTLLGGIEAAYIERPKPSLARTIARRLLGSLVVAVLCALLFVAASDIYVRVIAGGRTHDKIEELPDGWPVLVFGTAPKVSGGRDNTYFHSRMRAAAALYHGGKNVPFIVVSGDNRTDSYNEPREMRRALVALGVPGEKIVFDFAGRRTLDSVGRFKEVFRQERVIFVSQKFQNERAICLARHYGMDARGYNSGGEASGLAWWRIWARERLARVLLLLDLYLLDTGPKLLGPPEPVPASEPKPIDP